MIKLYCDRGVDTRRKVFRDNPLSVKDLWVDIEPIISEKDLSSPYDSSLLE